MLLPRKTVRLSSPGSEKCRPQRTQQEEKAIDLLALSEDSDQVCVVAVTGLLALHYSCFGCQEI